MMIQQITDFAPYRNFIDSFLADRHFSHPMLETEEQLCRKLRPDPSRTDRHTLGVFRGGTITGLFAFLILEEEHYIEMLAGLSREGPACEEILQYLRGRYPGYSADFVFNPDHHLIRERLEERGARFETVQQKMVFTHRRPAVEPGEVVPLSPRYLDQYLSMHRTDRYWTGERVAEAPDRFRTLLAVEDGTVAGYLDVTHCYPENEPYDLLVREEYRRRGHGRRLLAEALRLNEPKDMMLQVDIDNVPAIRLYESMGFQKAPHQDSLTAHWKIPPATA